MQIQVDPCLFVVKIKVNQFWHIAVQTWLTIHACRPWFSGFDFPNYSVIKFFASQYESTTIVFSYKLPKIDRVLVEETYNGLKNAIITY
jgi:hypothetical protein